MKDENGKLKVESRFHFLYDSSKKRKKAIAQKLRKSKKKAGGVGVLARTLCNFPKVKKDNRPKLSKMQKKNGRRCGSDKNSLELVHREFFGRFTPGARFFCFITKSYAFAAIFSVSETFVR